MDKSLNEKWWYRLFKVVVITILLFVGFCGSYLLYNKFKPTKIIDNEKTIISCYNEEHTAKELDLIYFVDVDDYFIYNAKENCKKFEFQKNPEMYPEKERVISFNQIHYEKYGGIDWDKKARERGYEPEKAISNRVPDDNNFSIDKHYKLENLNVYLYIAILWLILCILFEIIRRIFGYVVLGEFKGLNLKCLLKFINKKEYRQKLSNIFYRLKKLIPTTPIKYMINLLKKPFIWFNSYMAQTKGLIFSGFVIVASFVLVKIDVNFDAPFGFISAIFLIFSSVFL